jgi:hypothetical protein
MSDFTARNIIENEGLIFGLVLIILALPFSRLD